MLVGAVQTNRLQASAAAIAAWSLRTLGLDLVVIVLGRRDLWHDSETQLRWSLRSLVREAPPQGLEVARRHARG